MAFSTRKFLTEIKGLSEAKVEKILQAASKIVPMGFTSVRTPV